MWPCYVWCERDCYWPRVSADGSELHDADCAFVVIRLIDCAVGTRLVFIRGRYGIRMEGQR